MSSYEPQLLSDTVFTGQGEGKPASDSAVLVSRPFGRTRTVSARSLFVSRVFFRELELQFALAVVSFQNFALTRETGQLG